jgi:hypothetical protein
MAAILEVTPGVSINFLLILSQIKLLLLVAAVQVEPAVAKITIELTSGPERRVEVVGLSPDTFARLDRAKLSRGAWQRILALYVDTGSKRQALPVLGDYRVQGDRLVFTPQFPLKPGLAYRAVFDATALPDSKKEVHQARVETRLLIPEQTRGKPAVVEAVYPSGDTLPENLLKFYIHFSAPMSRGGSYRHIRLLDSTGAVVDLPFLELAEELWDQSGRRLTLLLDPGRVKQELKPNQEVGRALMHGNEYSLLIAETWPDARGVRLAREHRKNFRVVAADTQQPDEAQWKLTLPDAGTRQPLTVKFNEPLDHALLQHAIRVVDPSNETLDGRIEVTGHETEWHFRPENPWVAGAHQLFVDTTLEDRSGNSIGRPFEVDLRSGPSPDTPDCTIAFTIGDDSAPLAAPQSDIGSR